MHPFLLSLHDLLRLNSGIIWRRQWHPTPVLLPGKSHGRRSLVGCGPWGHEESDLTEWLHIHFSLSCTGERNGNPLQCSCPENPRDGGAWWAAIYGVAQSRTRLKWLSSSSRSRLIPPGNFPESLGYVKSSSIEPHDTLGSLCNTFHVILKWSVFGWLSTSTVIYPYS